MKVRDLLSKLETVDEELEVYAYSESVGKTLNINDIFFYGSLKDLYVEINIE